MKVKTAELSGVQLDYAVAKAKGLRLSILAGEAVNVTENGDVFHHVRFTQFWSLCGTLVEDNKLHISHNPSGRRPDEPWFCCDSSETFWSTGESAMLAICRAVVASKLGDTVDIPDELMESK